MSDDGITFIMRNKQNHLLYVRDTLWVFPFWEFARSRIGQEKWEHQSTLIYIIRWQKIEIFHLLSVAQLTVYSNLIFPLIEYYNYLLIYVQGKIAEKFQIFPETETVVWFLKLFWNFFTFYVCGMSHMEMKDGHCSCKLYYFVPSLLFIYMEESHNSYPSFYSFSCRQFLHMICYSHALLASVLTLCFEFVLHFDR